MKRFLVCAAVFAAMFLTVSCGDSDSNGGNAVNGDGHGCVTAKDSEHDVDCGGSDVKYCKYSDEAYFEVDGKKYQCATADDCRDASIQLAVYCGKKNDDLDENNGDYEDGFYCEDDAECSDGSMMRICTNGTESYYKVHGKKYEFSTSDLTAAAKAIKEARKECGLIDDDENGEEEDDDNGNNGGNEEGGDTDENNGENDEEGGDTDTEEEYYCSDADECADGSVMRFCTNGDDGYFEVNGEKFEYDNEDQASMAAAAQQASAKCNPEEE